MRFLHIGLSSLAALLFAFSVPFAKANSDYEEVRLLPRNHHVSGQGYGGFTQDTQFSMDEYGCVLYSIFRDAPIFNRPAFPLPVLGNRFARHCIYAAPVNIISDYRTFFIVPLDDNIAFWKENTLDDFALFGYVPAFSYEEGSYAKALAHLGKFDADDVRRPHDRAIMFGVLVKTGKKNLDNIYANYWNGPKQVSDNDTTFPMRIAYRNLELAGAADQQRILETLLQTVGGRWLTRDKSLKGLLESSYAEGIIFEELME